MGKWSIRQSSDQSTGQLVNRSTAKPSNHPTTKPCPEHFAKFSVNHVVRDVGSYGAAESIRRRIPNHLTMRPFDYATNPPLDV